MAQDYPDGFARSLPGHSVDLESGFATPWLESMSASIAASGSEDFELEIDDDEHIFYIDSINVTPLAYTEFLVTVYINDVAYWGGSQMGFLEFNPRINPSLVFISGDVIKVTCMNLDGSTHTFDVKIHGTKIARPASYGKSPGAYFSVSDYAVSLDDEVEFTDLSTYSPTSWLWDFDDGSTPSTEQNPSHAYTEEGSYYPVLRAANAYGFDTYSLIAPIVVTDVPPAPDWIEVDPNSTINIASGYITFLSHNIDGSAYVYHDYGVGYFDAYTIYFAAKVTNASTTSTRLAVLALSNSIGGLNTDYGYRLVVLMGKTGTDYTARLHAWYNTAGVAYDTSVALTADTFYYFKLVHAASSTTCTLYIYSDEARTVLVDTLVITTAHCADLTRYFYGLSGGLPAISGTIDGSVGAFVIQTS